MMNGIIYNSRLENIWKFMREMDGSGNNLLTFETITHPNNLELNCVQLLNKSNNMI